MSVFPIIISVLYILSFTALGITLLYARTADALPDSKTQTALLVFALICFALAAKNLWHLVKVIFRKRRSEQSDRRKTS
ncbi:MAG: hypothetical protein IKN55_04375 [Oscillospiraceae bacterium]|nr:hypothetical protein [Oscillospiraceae bacterium]